VLVVPAVRGPVEPRHDRPVAAIGHVVYQATVAAIEIERLLLAATDLAPLRSPWRIRYANFQRLTGASEAGNKLLAEIIQRTPDYIPAWIDVMNVACRQKRDPDCAEIIEKILVQNPVNYDALLALKFTKQGP
jgi:hypothetical protein